MREKLVFDQIWISYNFVVVVPVWRVEHFEIHFHFHSYWSRAANPFNWFWRMRAKMICWWKVRKLKRRDMFEWRIIKVLPPPSTNHHNKQTEALNETKPFEQTCQSANICLYSPIKIKMMIIIIIEFLTLTRTLLLFYSFTLSFFHSFTLPHSITRLNRSSLLFCSKVLILGRII